MGVLVGGNPELQTKGSRGHGCFCGQGGSKANKHRIAGNCGKIYFRCWKLFFFLNCKSLSEIKTDYD